MYRELYKFGLNKSIHKIMTLNTISVWQLHVFVLRTQIRRDKTLIAKVYK